MENRVSHLPLLLAATLLLPFLAAPAHADGMNGIQFFPPSNMDGCNANTALMFDGKNGTRCAVPPGNGSSNTVSLPFNGHNYAVPTTITCSYDGGTNGEASTVFYLQGSVPLALNIGAPIVGADALFYSVDGGQPGSGTTWRAYAIPSGAQLPGYFPAGTLPSARGCPASIPIQEQ